MAANPSLIQGLLHDVTIYGSVCIHQRKLAWMLGRKNMNASAFELLLDEWNEELNEDRSKLRGLGHGNYYTIMIGEPEQITDWTK